MAIKSMKNRKKIKILCYTWPRNRQGMDLAEILSEKGYLVTLYQLDDSTNESIKNNYEKMTIQTPSIVTDNQCLNKAPFVKGFLRVLLFFKYAMKGNCDVVIAINYQALLVSAVISIMKNAKLVYYPLEFIECHRQKKIERFLCEKYVDVIINVEKTRMKLLKKFIKRNIISFVVPNAPRKGIPTRPRGRLIKYLKNCGLYSKKEKLIIFHGSYQKYAFLERIVNGTTKWPQNTKLILMITGAIPEELRKLISIMKEKVVLVPATTHKHLYKWVRDANVGLLSYEDKHSLNVKYCSPQKMFDYLACGIPFIGSNRPIIKEVTNNYNVGICADMMEAENISSALKGIIANHCQLEEMSINARKAYVKIYNYDHSLKPFLEHLEVMF